MVTMLRAFSNRQPDGKLALTGQAIPESMFEKRRWQRLSVIRESHGWYARKIRRYDRRPNIHQIFKHPLILLFRGNPGFPGSFYETFVIPNGDH
jgi:hypothetical protein